MNEATSIEAFREAYEASGRNPIYALHALILCPRDVPLPTWVRDAMGRIADAVLELDSEYWARRDDPKAASDAVRRLLAALGFTKQGWNAFADQASRNEGAWTALDARWLAAAYGNRKEAIGHICDESGKSRTTVYDKIALAKRSGLSKD